MITTQIITFNNEKTIKKTLNSLLPIKSKINILDLGSSDKTILICKEYKAKIHKIENVKDYAEIRNQHTEQINFYIEPWEEIISGHNEIAQCQNNRYIQIIEDKIIIKQIRIWDNSSLFVNPAYETIRAKCPILQNVYIQSLGGEKPYTEQLITQWHQNRPTDQNAIYYQSFVCLKNKKYKEYLELANKFIFIKNSDEISICMTKYYMASVMIYIFNDFKKSTNLILECIIQYPTMAEFWCLLGDIYYKSKDYGKAKEFYENALIIGERRLSDDLFPLDIDKYQLYPQKMMNNCDKIIQDSKMFQKLDK